MFYIGAGGIVVGRVTYVEAPCKSVLNRVEGMPFKWSINPYSGCAHACRYCYARAFYVRADRGSAADFDRVIYVKRNAPMVLRAELARRCWKRELVAVGAATDPYQPAEAKYQITRGILEALRDGRTPVSLITRSPLILRDIDVLRELDQRGGLEVHITIPTMNREVWRTFEPHTPSPKARMDTVRRLNEAGIRTGVFLAPILPGITDTDGELRRVMEAAVEAGAPYVVPITLRLAPGVREWFLPHISRYYPHLTLQYCRLYQRTEASSDYKQRALGLAGRILRELGLSGRVCQPAPRQELEPIQLRLSI